SVPLGPLARGWRNLVGLAALTAAIGGIGWSWWDAPGHRARQALDRAAQVEKDGGREKATAAFEAVARDYSGRTDDAILREAGAGVVRTGLASLSTPMTEATVDPAARLVRRFMALPRAARDEP